jgi:hypothetical protein
MKIVKYMIAAVLLAMASACSAKADSTDQESFTVNIVSGPEAGDTFTGSFTYDATTLAMTGNAALLSFTFTDPAWAGKTLSSTGLDDFGVNSMGVLNFFFAPGPAGAPDNAFSVGIQFGYGSTKVVGIETTVVGQGSVTYGTPGPVATPEPSALTLLVPGLLGLIPLARRRLHLA